MSKKRESKTNAMRILDAAHVDHVIHSVDATGEDTGVDIAHRAGEDPDHVFKTLVTQGKSGEHLVFMIPVACELDLRKAARAAGEKSVAMVRSRELFELTAYVHGGMRLLARSPSAPSSTRPASSSTPSCFRVDASARKSR